MRVLIDRYGDSDDPSTGHRILPIDIEVEVTDGFPDPRKAENVITSIALYDCVSKQYFAFVLLDDHHDISNYTVDNSIIETFDTEEALLGKFYLKYMEISPTIITGWNSDSFDLPYLYNRTFRILGQEYSKCLSPINIVYHDSFKDKLIIAGVSSLDYLLLYKKFTFNQLESYKLDFVAQYELGENKIEYSGTLNELRHNNIKKFIKYNIQDVRLLNELDDKLNFIDIARGICHIGHVPYEDIYLSSRYLEGAMMTYLHQIGVVSPNKQGMKYDGDSSDSKFVGAYVQDPKRGKHTWVYDLDLTSMYPSIIMSLNISPETKLGKVVGWDPIEFLSSSPKTYTITINTIEVGKMTKTELREYLDKNKISIASNGVMYKTDKMGLIPTLLLKWFNSRVEFRKLAKKFADEGNDEKYQYFNRRQYLQKILLNSLYGVLGLSVFRFYDLDNAEAVTETGQSLIKFTKKIANYYYTSMLNSTVIKFTLSNGTTKTVRQDTKLIVNRDGRKQTIFARNLKQSDDFVKVLQ